MTDSLDIKAKAPFPAGALSNFAPHPFTIDGIDCASRPPRPPRRLRPDTKVLGVYDILDKSRTSAAGGGPSVPTEAS